MWPRSEFMLSEGIHTPTQVYLLEAFLINRSIFQMSVPKGIAGEIIQIAAPSFLSLTWVAKNPIFVTPIF